MSTLKSDAITAATGTNTDLDLSGKGSGVPDIATGFKVGGTAGVPVNNLRTGTDGELITWDASGDPATVAVGTATHVLTSNGVGAAPTFQVGGGGQWSLKTSGTVSAGASLIITGITKRTFIFLRDVTLDTADTSLYFDLSENSGVSWDSDPNWVDTYQSSGSTSLTTTRSSGSAQTTLNSALAIDASSENALNSWIELPDPAQTTAFVEFKYNSIFGRYNNAGDWYHNWGFGARQETGAVDQVRFISSSGNLTIGYYFVWEQGE